jgi:hypothetical protein
MDAARVAKAPQFALYGDGPELDTGQAVSSAPVWRGPIWSGVRWVGISSCVLLFGLLTVAMLTQPIGAAIERLIGPGLDWRRDQAAVEPSGDGGRRTTPELALGLDGPTLGSPAVLERGASAASTRADRVTSLDSDGRPLARGLPIPTFKPLPSAP